LKIETIVKRFEAEVCCDDSHLRLAILNRQNDLSIVYANGIYLWNNEAEQGNPSMLSGICRTP